MDDAWGRSFCFISRCFLISWSECCLPGPVNIPECSWTPGVTARYHGPGSADSADNLFRLLGLRDAHKPLEREIIIQRPILEILLQFLVEHQGYPGRFDHDIVIMFGLVQSHKQLRLAASGHTGRTHPQPGTMRNLPLCLSGFKLVPGLLGHRYHFPHLPLMTYHQVNDENLPVL